jgi:hypothetical protein
MFGNPDYFNQVANTANGHGHDCSNAPACVFESRAFAWNHGDVQQDITRTWFGMVGPGVQKIGRNDDVFSDHADLRPTILALLGLTDDYVSDGRVLIEFVEPYHAPALISSSRQFISLAQVYKQINAPVGTLGLASLKYANNAITSDDATYGNYLSTIAGITSTRDGLAGQMISLLNGAAFLNQRIDPHQANSLIAQGNELISTVQGLAGP